MTSTKTALALALVLALSLFFAGALPGGMSDGGLTRAHALSGDSGGKRRAQCFDRRDNDGDGKIDYPADPGCTDGNDNDERDVVTPPPPAPVVLFEDHFLGAPGAKPDALYWDITDYCSTSADDAYTCWEANNVFQSGQGTAVIRVSAGTHGRPYDGGRFGTWRRDGWPSGLVKYTVDAPVRLEARVKVAPGAGLWPAFWPENPLQPASSHLELDIMELRMFQPTVSTCHVHGVTEAGNSIDTGVDLSAGFHVYWANYFTDHVVFGVDSLTCGDFPLPAHYPVGLQFTHIVGPPTLWGGQGGPPPASALPADMHVDYVRVTR